MTKRKDEEELMDFIMLTSILVIYMILEERYKKKLESMIRRTPNIFVFWKQKGNLTGV